MAGVLTNLHAVYVQYHIYCKAMYLGDCTIHEAMHKCISKDKYFALDSITTYLVENKADVHNSVSKFAK